MKAVVLAGGTLKVTARLKSMCREASLVIAADSGLKHAVALGVTPDLIIGDFDSVAAEDLATFADVTRERHPTDKDELDLELALEVALAQGASDVRVLGALGGRFDQSLATLLIAARLCTEGTDISLHTGTTDVYLLAGEATHTLELPPGTTFSLLSLQGMSQVSVAGARFPLEHAPLGFGLGLGLSNVTERSQTHITLHQGLLAVVVEREAP